jgi:hypothetical protein
MPRLTCCQKLWRGRCGRVGFTHWLMDHQRIATPISRLIALPNLPTTLSYTPSTPQLPTMGGPNLEVFKTLSPPPSSLLLPNSPTNTHTVRHVHHDNVPLRHESRRQIQSPGLLAGTRSDAQDTVRGRGDCEGAGEVEGAILGKQRRREEREEAERRMFVRSGRGKE